MTDLETIIFVEKDVGITSFRVRENNESYVVMADNFPLHIGYQVKIQRGLAAVVGSGIEESKVRLIKEMVVYGDIGVEYRYEARISLC